MFLVGISMIAASSPQAKGRIERAHSTHQDRLVKKLRLRGIASYEVANRFLEEHYLAEHDRRHAHRAPKEADYHRRRPSARQLDEVFWLEEGRVMSQDWVVRYKNRWLQLQRQTQHWAPAKSRVLVRENEVGEIAVHYRAGSASPSTHCRWLLPGGAREEVPLPPAPPSPLKLVRREPAPSHHHKFQFLRVGKRCESRTADRKIGAAFVGGILRSLPFATNFTPICSRATQ